MATSALHASLSELREEVLDLYLDWREEAAAVAAAYGNWAGAPGGEERTDTFTAYSAALDREEAAARNYAEVLANCERLPDS